eukprot:513974_1
MSSNSNQNNSSILSMEQQLAERRARMNRSHQSHYPNDINNNHTNPSSIDIPQIQSIPENTTINNHDERVLDQTQIDYEMALQLQRQFDQQESNINNDNIHNHSHSNDGQMNHEFSSNNNENHASSTSNSQFSYQITDSNGNTRSFASS